jgi:hypothetical protein
MIEDFFTPLNTFGLGFGLCAIFLILAVLSHWKTKREFRRYKSHLSDKLDLDSKQIQDLNKERARLSQENEHLRLQVARLNERPDNKLNRELEIFGRAEKHMMINAPGFAPAWEMAKSPTVNAETADAPKQPEGAPSAESNGSTPPPSKVSSDAA